VPDRRAINMMQDDLSHLSSYDMHVRILPLACTFNSFMRWHADQHDRCVSKDTTCTANSVRLTPQAGPKNVEMWRLQQLSRMCHHTRT
jgi:hypothetical protein